MDKALRELTQDGAAKRVALLKRDIFEMKIKRGFGQLEETSAPKTKRREVARLLTLVKEDAIGLRALKGTRTEVPEEKGKAGSAKISPDAAPAKIKAPAREAAKAKSADKEEAAKPGKAKGFFDRFRLRRSGTRGQ